ncbi:NADPH-dependent F420 reductase [Streptomyces sp. bgisy082]|uniref:NADPH-dependent F420 reductase n=1 Tax=Streptomyces sp. bgisy082 TaxID=3413776 RepID=UPI003D7265B9
MLGPHRLHRDRPSGLRPAEVHQPGPCRPRPAGRRCGTGRWRPGPRASAVPRKKPPGRDVLPHRRGFAAPTGAAPDEPGDRSRTVPDPPRDRAHEGRPMKIGIIGAGNIGGNLTRRLTALGHAVSVANSRGPETLTALAEETGATPVPVTEAADGAELVVVTIPLKNLPDLPGDVLAGAAEGFVLVDTNNYYPRERDGRIAAIEDEGLTESRWTERQLGHPVVKAFNGTYAQDILDRPRPAGDPERIALPIAGDDEAAKDTVRALVDELGFDTVDAGGIDDSWRQQPDTPVYGLRAGADAVTKALAEASPERPASFRG